MNGREHVCSCSGTGVGLRLLGCGDDCLDELIGKLIRCPTSKYSSASLNIYQPSPALSPLIEYANQNFWTLHEFLIMAFVIYFILLTAASSIYATSFSLAKQVAQPFSTRALNAAGGWALSQSTCPTDMTTCNLGSCCPSSLTCVHIAGSGIANLCCPGSKCLASILLSISFISSSLQGLHRAYTM